MTFRTDGKPKLKVTPKPKMTKLSILIPTYNRARYLRECLNSLLSTTVDCEIFVGDDASTDNTEAVVKSYTDPRIRYFRQPENIHKDNFSYLYREACGEYLCMFNDDDRALPGCFEKKIAILDRCPEVDFVYSLWNRIDADGRNHGVVQWPGLATHSYIGGRDEFRDLLVASYIMMQSIVIRRSCFEAKGSWDTSGALLVANDWDFYLRQVRGATTAFIHEPTVEVRVHPQSETSTNERTGRFERDRLTIWRRYLIDDPNPPTVDPLMWQWMEHSFTQDAYAHVGAESSLLKPLLAEFYELKREVIDRQNLKTAIAVQGQRPSTVEPGTAQVVWFGAIYDPSGYADEARGFILGLHELGLPIAARAIGRHSERFRTAMPKRSRERLDQALARKGANGAITVIHFPGYAFQRIEGAGYQIGRTMYESDSLPSDWVTKCNELDEIWVPSQHNVRSFRQAGVTKPIVCVPEGVDTIKFRPGLEAMPIQGARRHVFLAIFEWIHRKGWDVLLRAWAEAFRPDAEVTLVLRTYPINSIEGDQKEEIERRINEFLEESLGLSRREVAPIIVLGEQIPDDDMPHLYAAACAYVAPSRGEGWGRPHMEAMASGLPVIATRWSGNLDFMSDSNSLLIDVEALSPVDARAEATLAGHRWAEPSVPSLVAHLRSILDEPARVAAIRKRARLDMVKHWRWQTVVGVAARRLREIMSMQLDPRRIKSGVTPGPSSNIPKRLVDAQQAPQDRASAHSDKACIRLRWEGSQFVHHSLGHVNRELCAALLDSGSVDLEILPYEQDTFSPPPGSRFERLKKRTRHPLLGRTEVHVRHQWPPRFDPPPDGTWVMIQPWEFGHIPANWVRPMRDLVDEIWVPTNWVRDCYIASGVPQDKVFVVPNGVDPELYRPEGPLYPLKTKKRTKFLFVGGLIYRKGIDLLVNTFLETFSARDDVCLVIKGFGSDSVYSNSSMHLQLVQLAERARRDPSLPEIEYLPQSLSDEEMAALYRACDVLVHPYRGEGFGLPIVEAMATALPVVVTNHGACLDFCDESNAYLIPADIEFISPGDFVNHVRGHWLAAPDREALAMTLKHIVVHPIEARSKGQLGRRHIIENLRWEHSANVIRERLSALASRAPVRTTPPEQYFRRDVLKLELQRLKGTSFLLHPDWHGDSWKEILSVYAKTFDNLDDVTLVLYTDPDQGYSLEALDTAYREIMQLSGRNETSMPDILLVTDELSLAGIGMLYSAVDCVLSANDVSSSERARASGKSLIENPTPNSFRTFVEQQQPAPVQC